MVFVYLQNWVMFWLNGDECSSTIMEHMGTINLPPSCKLAMWKSHFLKVEHCPNRKISSMGHQLFHSFCHMFPGLSSSFSKAFRVYAMDFHQFPQCLPLFYHCLPYKVVPPKRYENWFINPMNTIDISPTKP